LILIVENNLDIKFDLLLSVLDVYYYVMTELYLHVYFNGAYKPFVLYIVLNFQFQSTFFKSSCHVCIFFVFCWLIFSTYFCTINKDKYNCIGYKSKLKRSNF